MQKLIKEIHENNKLAGWWNDPLTGESLFENRLFPYVVATKILLVVTELAEATEGYRKDLMDDKLPHRKMIEVEIADAIIRLMDISGALNLDIEGAINEKRNFNSERPDHKIDNRLKLGGKKF